MSNSRANGYLVSKPYAWYVFVLLMGLMLFDFIDRNIIVSIFPFLKKDFGLTDAQCGLLMAAVAWSITAFVIPTGWLVDRWSRKKTVGLMSVFWSLSTMACAFTGNFSQLLTMRFFIGAGEAGYVPAGNSLISALFPQRIRARLVGLFVGAAPIGIAIGTALGGWIGHRYGWRAALGLVGLPGLILAILIFFIRDYKTVDLTIKASESKESAVLRKMTKKEIVKNILGKPSVILVFLGQASSVFYTMLFGAWLPTFFIRVHKLPIVEASLKAGLVSFLSVFGCFLGGYLADRFVIKGRLNGRPLVAALFQLFNCVILLSAFGLAQGQVQFFLLMVGGITLLGFNGPVYSAISELVHPGLRSTAVSLMTSFQNLVGMGFGPLVAGALSDKLGIAKALLILSVLPAVSMSIFLLVLPFYNRDLKSVEYVEMSMEDK